MLWVLGYPRSSGALPATAFEALAAVLTSHGCTLGFRAATYVVHPWHVKQQVGENKTWLRGSAPFPDCVDDGPARVLVDSAASQCFVDCAFVLQHKWQEVPTSVCYIVPVSTVLL